MRRRARIRVKTDRIEEVKYIYESIKENIYEASIYNKGFLVRLYTDTKEYEYLMKEISNNNLKFSYAEAREYTKKEMEGAELYHAKLIYPYQSDPKDAVDFGTEYEENTGCPKCGRGEKQKSDLIIDLNKVKKYPIATMAPEVFARSDIKEMFEENNITGIRFGRVQDYKNRELPEFYQLFIDNILPPLSDKVRIEHEDCSKCKICGFGGIYPRSELIYNSTILDKAKDFNLTYEYLWGYGLREIIISSKVRDLLKKSKCRVAYEPIAIIG